MSHPCNTTSSAAQPIGECPRCGGQLYALLTHHCSTAVKITMPLANVTAPVCGVSCGCGYEDVEDGSVLRRRWFCEMGPP